MKNLLKAGTLILFVGLISTFVAYRSGLFNSAANETTNVERNIVPTVAQDDVDTVTKNTKKQRVSGSTEKTDFDRDSRDLGHAYHNLISSSKSVIVHEKWNEHGAAIAKFVKQMDSIKKLDSIQRAKEWETVSPR